MPPTIIMLIRHGEKPVVAPPYGIDADGNQDKYSLIVRGWQRAGALVNFFRSPAAAGIAMPATIYASAVNDLGLLVDGDDVGKSLRPQQTVTPLAAALNLQIVTKYAVGQEAELVAELRGLAGIVLVAWEHKHIPLIAQPLSPDAPAQWPGGSVFDIVWVLQPKKGAYGFAQVQQHILAGDAA